MALEFIKPTYSPVKTVNGQTGDVIIEMPSIEGFATEAYVDKKVAEAATGGEINLDAYATKDYVDDAIAAIPSTPGGDIDLSDYATKDELNGMNNYFTDTYATKTYVDEAIANVPSAPGGDVDLSDYYTKSEIDEKIGELPVIEDEEGINLVNTVVDFVYVATSQVEGYVASVEANISENYYSRSEIDELLANLPAGDIPSGEEVEF